MDDEDAAASSSRPPNPKRILSLRTSQTSIPDKRRRADHDPDQLVSKAGDTNNSAPPPPSRSGPPHPEGDDLEGSRHGQHGQQPPGDAHLRSHSHSHSHSGSRSQSPSSDSREEARMDHGSGSHYHSHRHPRSSASHSSDTSSRSPHDPSRPGPRSRHSMPSWQTSSEDESFSTPTQDNVPPTSTARHPYQSSSTSGPSRVSSPPPSFSLSSGRPLVNPPIKTQAAFVGKLYAMLEDEDIKKTGLIHWSADGTLFTCPNPTEFSKVVLPQFFKHNNWQSFVRQLNMYSFSKVSRTDRDGKAYRLVADAEQVNDLYVSATDPGAWEFRHPLFRRGEPLLLASIKRKTTRLVTQEGTQSSSPVDEHDGGKSVAGWMRDASQATFWTKSPPREMASGSRPRLYGYNVPIGESTTLRTQEERRTESRGYQWETASTVRMPLPPPETSRYHPDPTRPPLSARYGPLGYSDYPFYPQPQHSAVDSLENKVATLEEVAQRLVELVNVERVENVRSHLDFSSYLLQLTGWVGEGTSLSPFDVRALQDTLNRHIAELRQRYETLAASDALAIIATGGSERHYRSGAEVAPPYNGQHAGSLDRRPNTTLPEPCPLSAHNTPRSSPSIGKFSDTSRRTPAESAYAVGGGGGGSYSGGSVHLPALRGSHSRDDDTRSGPYPPTSEVRYGDQDELMGGIKPKTGLSSLLN